LVLFDQSIAPSPTLPLAVLLELSEEESAAREWARTALAGYEVRIIHKADLRWKSRREALKGIRSLSPAAFAIFSADLQQQNSRRAMLLFGAATGAKRIVIGDLNADRVDRSRTMTAILEGLAFGWEIVLGYGMIIPITWLLTLFIGWIGPVLKANRMQTATELKLKADPSLSGLAVQHGVRSALYLRALPIISQAARPAVGGMISHVGEFIIAACSLGHRLVFATCGDMGFRAPGETLTMNPSAAFGANRALFELWNSLVFTVRLLVGEPGREAVRNSVFIYIRYSRFSLTGILLSLVWNRPAFIEYNGSEVWVGRNWDPVGQEALLRRAEHLNLRLADVVIVVSGVERRNLIDAGVPSAKILLNPNGVDVDRFRPGCGGAMVRRRFGIEDQVVIGFVGTFGPWHGTEVLASAAVILSDPKRFHFLFIGEGESRPAAKQIIDSGGCAGIATFTGRVPHLEVPAYLDACDILVATNLRNSDGSDFFGSPTKLFEYLAMSKPVIASRVGQIAEIIKDGEDGILVEPGNADELAGQIERLAAEADLRGRIGEAGRRIVSSAFTWRQNALRVFNRFEEQFGYHDREMFRERRRPAASLDA
jgi:glycosyltransferase involved in cell wall biosynthesis